MTTYAQLLGWHRLAVAPSLQIFSEGVRALFNAGENVQRFHLEHKLHLSRTTDVLLTTMSTTTSAGLPGLLLSLESAGVKHIRLWGPAVLQEFVEVAIASFAGLRGISIEYRIPQGSRSTSPFACSCKRSSISRRTLSSSSNSSATSSGSPSPSSALSASSFPSVDTCVGASSPNAAEVTPSSTRSPVIQVRGDMKRRQADEASCCCERRSRCSERDTKKNRPVDRSSSSIPKRMSPTRARTPSPDISESPALKSTSSSFPTQPSTGSALASLRGTIGNGLTVEAVLLPYISPRGADIAAETQDRKWRNVWQQSAAQRPFWQSADCHIDALREKESEHCEEDGESGGNGPSGSAAVVGKRARVGSNPLLEDSEDVGGRSDAPELEEARRKSDEAEEKQALNDVHSANKETLHAREDHCAGLRQEIREGAHQAKSSMTRGDFCGEDTDAGGTKLGDSWVFTRDASVDTCAHASCSQLRRPPDQRQMEYQPISTSSGESIDWAQKANEEFEEAFKEGGTWQRGPPFDVPLHEGGSGGDCVAYVLTGQDVPGTFHPEKAKALGVPVGPLFSRLKSGATVELPNGTVVKSEDVCDAPQPGQAAVVLHCLSRLQATYAQERLSVDLRTLCFVFHMTPWNIAQTPEYQQLVRALTGPHTTHILCDRSHEAVTVSPFVHSSKLQEFLHSLLPPLFPRPSAPLRWEEVAECPPGRLASTTSKEDRAFISVFPGLTKFDMTSVPKRSISEQEALVAFRPSFTAQRLSTLQFFTRTYQACRKLLWEISTTAGPIDLASSTVPSTAENLAKDSSDNDSPNVSSVSSIDPANPTGELCSVGIESTTTKADGASSEKELYNEDMLSRNPITSVSKKCVNGLERTQFEEKAVISDTTRVFPTLKILGTGAAAPSQYRNVSGLLLSIRRNLSVILDCGEGSLSQLYSMCLSWKEFCEIIASIRILFISHLHADHHLGICSLLLLRGKLFPALKPPLVVAPLRLKEWLRFYSRAIARIPHTFMESRCFLSSTDPRIAARALGEQGCADHLALQATAVEHIPGSFGIRVDVTGNQPHAEAYSVVYSGDTRPCHSLFDLAKTATLLIHEATFEDSLIEEAIKKRHSSLTEVLTKASDSGCKSVILTHFSQRYPTIPVLGVQEAGGQAPEPAEPVAPPKSPQDSEKISVCSVVAETKEPSFDLLFAFDCMNVPLQHLRQLAPFFKLLPDTINELFAPT